MSIITLFTSFVFALPAAQGSWESQVNEVINKEISSSGVKSSHFGVWFKKGDGVATLNAEKQFVPASLSKIPTALTFLDQTSMDKRFNTWIYHTGEIKDGVLQGDLYLKGGGDPTLVTESIWLMVNELKRSDIKEVKGQFYVDESFFDDDYYSEGRQKKRVDRAYDAPVSALSFNWNSISIFIRPGQSSGDKARVYTDPDLPNIVIENKAKTTGHSKTNLAVNRILKDGKIIIEVSGKISTSKDEKAFYKSIGDAALWTGEAFKNMLNQAGIKYTGTVKKMVVPAKAKMLVEHDSWRMARVMSALSKFSNNFVAEMLTKQIGKTDDSPGNIDAGLLKITNYLKKNKWPENEFTFENPSGFTRKNKMRADLLGKLLDSARSKFDSAPEFMSSLPISGTDGTLKGRMKQTMRGKVRAKTGYLSGVVGLAGYLESPDGGTPITFVLFYNGSSKNDWEVRAMFNRLLWRVYQKS